MAGFTFFVFDFSGSGNSDGEYISLGFFEREDVETVTGYLRGTNLVSAVGLWGRSMGAVTALMYSDRDPGIACMCLDSPFADLKRLSRELVESKASLVPNWMIDGVLDSLREDVQKKVGFDLFSLNPLENHVSKIYVPAIFLSAENDELIKGDHAKDLCDKYQGDKVYINVKGSHNSSRDKEVTESIIIFFYKCFKAGDAVSDSWNQELMMSQQSIFKAEDKELQMAMEASLKINNKPPS